MAVTSDLESARRGVNSQYSIDSYTSAIRYWVNWHKARTGELLRIPVTQEVVIRFVLDHLPTMRPDGSIRPYGLPEDVDLYLVALGAKQKVGQLSVLTVKHRISVLGQAHVKEHLESPCEYPSVRAQLRAAGRAFEQTAIPSARMVLTAADIAKLLATCDDSVIGRRDCALLHFIWLWGTKSRHCIAKAAVEELVRDGDQYIHKPAVRPRGKPESVTISGDAFIALETWLRVSEVSEGPIFRRLFTHGRIGKPLEPHSIYHVIKFRLVRAGMLDRRQLPSDSSVP